MRLCDTRGCKRIYGHSGSHEFDLAESDAVNHPAHYTSDPSGVECIQITRHRTFNVGNAIKYLWRAGLKADEHRGDREKQLEDLRKAVWYINDEIARLAPPPPPTISDIDRLRANGNNA